MPLQIQQFICKTDNYGVLLHDQASQMTAAIDAPDAMAIDGQLVSRGWNLSHVFTTHHHADHVDGNFWLKEKYGCVITGPKQEAAKIPGLDEVVSGGQQFHFAGVEIVTYDCPGHTQGHIAFHVPGEKLLFAGDTLFAMGCGRVLEGSMIDMWHSVNQFRSLPPDTSVYCGHEYTEANAKFALSVEPENSALVARARHVSQQRKKGLMTCPTTIREELDTNPFLRCGSAEIRSLLGLETASDSAVFAELRRRKDSFR